MKKHVVTGSIRRLSQCHRTITNSYSYSWIRNQMFLLIHFEIQELWVIITTNTRTQPENFQILQISRRFPGALDTLNCIATTRDRPWTNLTIWSCCSLAWLSFTKSILFCMIMMCFNFMISMAAKCSEVCGCGHDSFPAAHSKHARM